MTRKLTHSVRSRAMGRRLLGARITLAFASLWLLAACGPPKQPPFEVRNELDQLVVDFYTPPERERFLETVAKRKERGGIVGATGQFLRETFPTGTPQTTIIEYFERIGGSCHDGDAHRGPIICEYCRNRNVARGYIIDTFYDRIEILWIVEIFGSNGSRSADPSPVTSALAYTVAKSGTAHAGDRGRPDVPGTCDIARSKLETRQYDERDPKLMMRQWAYGQGE